MSPGLGLARPRGLRRVRSTHLPTGACGAQESSPEQDRGEEVGAGPSSAQWSWALRPQLPSPSCCLGLSLLQFIPVLSSVSTAQVQSHSPLPAPASNPWEGVQSAACSSLGQYHLRAPLPKPTFSS